MSGSKIDPISVSDASDSSSANNDEDCILVGFSDTKVQKPGYCKICSVNVIDVMFYPCTHGSICHECFSAMNGTRRCPICNAKITKHEMFFLV